MKKTLTAVAALAIASTMVAAAETAAEVNDTLFIPERSIIMTGDPKAPGASRLVGIIYDTEDLHFSDPRAPRFLFLDREGRMALGIGGYVKGTLQYDMNGAIDDGSNFTTFKIPVPLNPAQRNQFYANANHSTIFLKMVGKETRLGHFQAYIQTNFSGGGNSAYELKLKQAWISLGAVTAGLTRSTFSDGAAGLPTIDDQGPSGEVTARNVLVQYKPRIGKHLTIGVSVEMPSADYTVAEGQCEAIKQRVPDIPAYVQWGWDGGQSHVRLSGILRNLSYRDLVAGRNHFKTGWGVQFSGVGRVVGGLSAYGQVAYGKGIARYINDLEGNDLDLVADHGGKMKAPGSLAVVGGLKYNITNRLFMTAGYSLCRLYDQGSMGPDTYRRGQYVVVNGIFDIVPSLRLGLEYLWGNRVNMDHASGHANRVMAMLQYSF